MNKRITSMICIKCGTKLPIDDYINGCPHCYERKENANVVPRYEGAARIDVNEKGLMRYREFLPYETFPTLGEGNTPVVRMDRLAKDLRLAEVYTKNEFQNPTGSHKDRINPLAVAHAIATGKDTICCASTGNEAVSCALYCAAAGIHCVCVVTNAITSIWKKAVLAAGAELVVTNSRAERMKYISEKLRTENWYCVTNQPDEPIGSPAIIIQGYKTIAYELYEEFGDEIPQYILMPTCRGDLLSGVYYGFQELLENGYLNEIPKLVAVEPIPRLEKVLTGEKHHTEKFPGATNLMPSIGGETVTYQSQMVLEKSHGFAISAPQEGADNYVNSLARYGIYAETSSALVFECLKKAIDTKQIPHNEKVLLILTSHGFKNDFV